MYQTDIFHKRLLINFNSINEKRYVSKSTYFDRDNYMKDLNQEPKEDFFLFCKSNEKQYPIQDLTSKNVHFSNLFDSIPEVNEEDNKPHSMIEQLNKSSQIQIKTFKKTISLY